jgi:hypothetical protein
MKKAGLVFIAVLVLFSGLSCTTERLATRSDQADDSGAGFLPMDRPVLVNNLWKKEASASAGDFTSYFMFFENGYMTQIDRREIADHGGFVFNVVNLGNKWEVAGNTLIHTTFDGNKSNAYEGGFINETTIRGKGKNRDLVLVTDEEIIDEYNSPLYAFCPMPLFPVRNKLLKGSGSEISVDNPNDFSVAVAIMTAEEAHYFLVMPRGSFGRQLPDGQYDVYFVYSTDPESLYQGDSITVRRQKLTLTLQPVIQGNYGMKKVN